MLIDGSERCNLVAYAQDTALLLIMHLSTC